MNYMPFTEFLKLNKEELSTLNPLLVLIEQFQPSKMSVAPDTSTLVSLIENIDLGLLIRGTFTYPKLDALCKQSELIPFWNERWRLCGHAHNPVDENDKKAEVRAKTHEYKPQVTLHTFELLKGIFIYAQYNFHQSSGNPIYMSYAPAYLKCAAQLGYFPALNALYKNAFQRNKLAEALIYATQLAALYWTPGYLLCCLIYYKADNYKEALLNLLVAEKLMPFSDAMINNAYQGQSVNSILSSAGLTSLTAAKSYLAELSDLPMNYVTSSLYTKAKEIADNIIQKFNSEEVLNDDVVDKNSIPAGSLQ
ncbi:TPA: DUF5630 domain-containing protein [Legionella anisa]